MKNRFIYPTVKNMLYVFLFFQIIPLCITLLIPGKNNLLFWIGFQTSPILLLITMPIKPKTEMDEREVYTTLKWQSRMLNLILPCLLIPLIWLALDPGSNGWIIIFSFLVPSYFIILITSILYKRDLGSFYVKAKIAH